MLQVPSFAASPSQRDRFVLAHRPPRRLHDPWRHQGVFVEDERAADGTVVPVATVLLTGRECPWRCVMCDLWKHTTEGDTPAGALPHQLAAALDTLRAEGKHARHVKLYNAGSFFDPRAVPVDDYADIAALVASFAHVIVESHPALIGSQLTRFRDALACAARDAHPPGLEVAMGLETAHADALRQLHKGFSLDQFRRAARDVQQLGGRLRVFLLVGVPFIPRRQQQDWILRSVEFAFDCDASAVSLIPTRSGNGAMEALAAVGAFDAPSLADVEAALEASLSLGRGRVFADLWDLQSFARCATCFESRRERLHAMNLEQRVRPGIHCAQCRTASRTA